ncbi:unnamed protein product, partial [Scytosiphon promiscuus]
HKQHPTLPHTSFLPQLPYHRDCSVTTPATSLNTLPRARWISSRTPPSAPDWCSRKSGSTFLHSSRPPPTPPARPITRFHRTVTSRRSMRNRRSMRSRRSKRSRSRHPPPSRWAESRRMCSPTFYRSSPRESSPPCEGLAGASFKRLRFMLTLCGKVSGALISRL